MSDMIGYLAACRDTYETSVRDVVRSDRTTARERGSPRRGNADPETLTEPLDRLDTLAAYVRAWTMPDRRAIGSELARCWTPRSTHIGPFSDAVRGFDGLTNLILDFPVMFPGAAFWPAGVPDLHHDVARLAWRMESTSRIRFLGRDYGYSVQGLDFIEFDQANRLRRVAVFFGPLANLPQM